MFNLREYKKTADRLTDLLPWAGLVAPGVILNKDGSLQRTLQFRGPDVESSTQEQLVAATARLNNALKRLESGWVLYIESDRRESEQYLPVCQFPDPVSTLIDAERREQFAAVNDNFVDYYYLTVQWLPPTTKSTRLSQLFVKRESSAKAETRQQLEYFIGSTDRLFDLLTNLFFEAVVLDDNQVLTYLHSTVSSKFHALKAPELPMYLDEFIADTPLLAGLLPKLGDKHLRVISILGFPGTTFPALLDQLNQLAFPYRWMTRFIALDKTEAEKQLTGYRRRWFAKRKSMRHLLQEVFTRQESALVDSSAMEKAKDIDEALQGLAENYVGYGYYTATITVMADDERVVTEQQRQIERIVNGLGFTTIAETINSVEAWLSSLPGHAYANVRQPLMNSLNLAHLLPFSAVWAGDRKDRHLHAPALMQAHTHSRTPFYFVNHIGGVGHQLVMGPTGAGKSVLLNFMALQFLRYKDAQVFIFDKGGSFLASTHGVGGAYYELGMQTEHLAFQPLADIDDEANKSWASEWLQMLLVNEKIVVTPAIKQALWLALGSLAETPRSQRTLTGFCALLQNQDLRQALSSYTLEGAFGMLLDADSEEERSERWQCYELSSLMNAPSVIAPVMSYIFHQLERRLDGSPTMLILDEAWLFLDHPLFAQKIREWLKSLRKNNASVIFATQSVSDALNSEISSTLLESCPSRILLPNDRALEPQVRESYLKLGLNDKQLEILSVAKPKQQYYYQSAIGNRLFDLLLQPIALAFCAASTPKDKKLIQSLLLANGDHTDFLKAYFASKGLAWAWEVMLSLSKGEDSE